MKPGYTISSVNTNKTVLETLHDIEKYLQENHILSIMTLKAAVYQYDYYRIR